MSKIRQKRTAEQLQWLLSELFQRELNDPRLQGVTITDVTIDRELEHADIYVNALGDEEREKEVMEALKKATGFLRREVAARMRLRKVPQLHMHWDPTLQQAMEVDAILDTLDIPPEEETPSAEDE